MPQMAPLLWLNLFVMFTATFIIFLILNYFIKTPNKMTNISTKLLKKEMIWKW
uniref:ATP synthase complex subunit 8 n=1 Tax=Sergia lucens TaxID=589641 RepID=A0A348AW06_9EUCA|nr:ATP synthase F0 subunit 8 [Sergia lucens]BBC69442.1 ATP synthase F0 subunit 8 [Sergia lucens]